MNMLEANRSKDVFTRHVDSVLAKCAKIRSLIGDLNRNYSSDPTDKKFLSSIYFSSMNAKLFGFTIMFWIAHSIIAAAFHPRAAQTLNNDLGVLDQEYNKLSEHVAQGERDNYDDEWLTSMFQGIHV